jgi:hypothetical protein
MGASATVASLGLVIVPVSELGSFCANTDVMNAIEQIASGSRGIVVPPKESIERSTPLL